MDDNTTQIGFINTVRDCVAVISLESGDDVFIPLNGINSIRKTKDSAGKAVIEVHAYNADEVHTDVNIAISFANALDATAAAKANRKELVKHKELREQKEQEENDLPC